MITNLREAKSNLSQLVQRAADGEEIVITVRGQPMARLMSVAPKSGHVVDRLEWADELAAAAEGARVGQRKATTQQTIRRHRRPSCCALWTDCIWEHCGRQNFRVW